MMVASETVLNAILSRISEKPPESGGILGGRDGIVMEYRLDKGKEKGTPCRYAPDIDFLNHEIELWDERKIHFMGMFHVHFGGAETLSSGDKEYIGRIMNAMPQEISCLYFPVIVMPERKMIPYKAIRKNGKIAIKREEIEYQGGI